MNSPLTGFAEVMRCLTEVLKPELDRPFALFGHSLEALLAFELARWLRDRHGREPVHLFVSGHNAPQAPDERENLSALDEPATIDMLRRLGCARSDSTAPGVHEVGVSGNSCRFCGV